MYKTGRITLFATMLALEIIATPIVILCFKTFDKKVAAVIAGTIFLSLGTWILIKLIKNTSFLKTFTFWAVLIHLFIGSIPMFLLRALNWNKDMSTLKIFSIPGHQYHYYAEQIYVLMVIATLIDLIISVFRRKISIKNPSQKGDTN